MERKREGKGRRAKGAKILNYINSIPVAHFPCHATWKGLVKRTAIGLASPPTRRSRFTSSSPRICTFVVCTSYKSLKRGCNKARFIVRQMQLRVNRFETLRFQR